MKKFLAVMLAISSIWCQAANNEIDIPEPGKMVINLSQWHKVAHEENYTMYMDVASVDAHQAVVELLSVVDFDPGVEWNYYRTPVPIKQIVAHGNLLCEHEKYIILNLWYLDRDANVVLIERYRFGEFGSEMGQAGTSRNTMMLMACRFSS